MDQVFCSENILELSSSFPPAAGGLWRPLAGLSPPGAVPLTIHVKLDFHNQHASFFFASASSPSFLLFDTSDASPTSISSSSFGNPRNSFSFFQSIQPRRYWRVMVHPPESLLRTHHFFVHRPVFGDYNTERPTSIGDLFLLVDEFFDTV